MATQSAHAPVPAKPPDAHFDENRSVYGFFRRHQKKLLYTAGFFTLLTFSITGPLLSVVHELFRGPLPMASIVVGGHRIQLQPADYQIGRLIEHNIGNGLLFAVLPPISAGEENRTDLNDVLAILRRAAIAEGIEPSLLDVDHAIKATVDALKIESASKLARNAGFQSLAQFREVVAEAMRIGAYVRLQTLVLDTSDANVLQQVLTDREKITLKVATYDEVAAETRLKAARTMSDDDLRKWMEVKTETEKYRLQVYDKPRWKLNLAALLLAPDQFDPAQWQADVLKDFTVGDEELKSAYHQERERFKIDGKDEYKPLEDADVKAELTRLLQAEKVMKHLLDTLRQKQTEALKPQNDELGRTQAASAEAERTVGELKAQVANKEREVALKKQELEQKPEDATLKQAHEALQKELTRLQDDVSQTSEVVDAKKRAVTEAETALKTARAEWDLEKAFGELTKDKKGFVWKPTTELKNGDELKDLKEFGLGQWATAANNHFENKGDLCYSPGRTTEAVLLCQATDVDPRPLKSWDKDLKPLLEGAYWTEQAKNEGVEKKKAMEAALLRLGKAKMPEKVAEIDGKRQSRVDERFNEWVKATEADIAEATARLATPKLGTQAKAGWQQKLDSLNAQLAGKEQRRKDFEAQIGKEIDAEIATEAKKIYGQVLEEAAAEAGFTVTTIGPYLRDLQERPRFDKTYDPTVVFLFRSQSQIKVDETTDVLVDSTNRRMHVATCAKVEPATAADVTRREFEALRSGTYGNSFADMQAGKAYQQAFTLKALESRYELKRPGADSADVKSAAK
ncbi:MAG TPA: hypothetical protein VFD82_17375 [Planctomycetota bacterium]|nr:hypothetical protein [Planctomycetota bacterium]